MIIVKNNAEKTFFNSFFAKTNTKLQLTISIYKQEIWSISDEKSILYIHENKTLDIPFKLGIAIKKFILNFEEYAFEDRKVFLSNTANFKNVDYNFIIFLDTNAYPYVYDYLKNGFNIVDSIYMKFDKEVFMQQILKYKFIK